jgi:hypothetical protein
MAKTILVADVGGAHVKILASGAAKDRVASQDDSPVDV